MELHKCSKIRDLRNGHGEPATHMPHAVRDEDQTTAEYPPDLQAVIGAWPTLPAPIKAGIVKAVAECADEG